MERNKKLEDVAKWNAKRTHKKREKQIKEGKRKNMQENLGLE